MSLTQEEQAVWDVAYRMLLECRATVSRAAEVADEAVRYRRKSREAWDRLDQPTIQPGQSDPVRLLVEIRPTPAMLAPNGSLKLGFVIPSIHKSDANFGSKERSEINSQWKLQAPLDADISLRELPPTPSMETLCSMFQSWMQSASPLQLKDGSVKDGIRSVLRACGLEPNE